MKKQYSHHFLMPSYLAMNSCALDISDQSLKYGEVKMTSKGLRLGRYGQEKIPSGVVVSGQIENESKLVEILKDLAKKKDLGFVRVSLPEEQMYLFTLAIPKTDKINLKETILLQLEEHIPLSAIDSIFDYNVISENNQTIFVQVLAVASSVIESYLSIFKKTGLTPLSFELEAQAIARSVIPREDSSSVMIVDFGESRSGVSIAHKGRVLFTTTLEIGGVTITKMIAKSLSVSFEEAEKMKIEYSLNPNSSNNDILPIIINGTSVLKDELEKQYTYWKAHKDETVPSEEIDRIILCGGEANLAGLASYLQKSMNIKVENANTWVNISDMEASVPDMPKEESFAYATVLGLALADYNQSGQPFINVLPLNEKQSLKKEYWMRFTNVAFSLLAFILSIAILLLLPSYFFSVSKLKLAESKLESFNTANPEIATYDINALISEINKKITTLSSSGKDPLELPSDKILKLATTLRSKGITLSSINYLEKENNTKVIELTGLTADRVTLRNYKSTLVSSPDIANVELPISDFLGRSNSDFSMVITLK